ncbi:MAG: type II toxin-antitoxin system HicB family antitoxin [Candidatus Altiarchaeota archaeon]|nr:type II toxin-antitoxin system HicB family antitoxin [Candidatus Altiarchaeota archaeon]
MDKYTLSAIVHKEGKWYVATSPETKVASQGKTVEEALKNLEEAVELYIEEFGYTPKEELTLLAKIQVKDGRKATNPVSA